MLGQRFATTAEL